ncbi:hypothetical protein Ahy_A05g023894 isoform A [Arachis hypogaea]|uniref:Pentatricopeptide repeat-containing protein n=1 Tax=Arachis hypogaea TaxID=3818 RepID=A0A445D4S5_ARAHY|nr:hypothetical protein Ahy_A05g023894 isoform A [Arachis hypogaea]
MNNHMYLIMKNTLSRMIEECKNLRELKRIHTHILKSPTLSNADQYHLITRVLFFCSFSNWGSFSYASNVFHMIKNPDIRVYNIMIRAYADMEGGNGCHFCRALMLYKKMLCRNIDPNSLTFPFLVKACTRRLDGSTGHVLHSQVIKNGELDMALDLFRKMKRKNIITWNSIITGLAQGGRAMESLEIFQEMLLFSQLGAIDHGKWVHGYLRRSIIECDVVIGTALITMYGKCGHVQEAFEIFKEMPEKDGSAWTAMISVFALHGLGWKALDCFSEMERAGVRPNHVTFVGLLSACAHSGLVDKGRRCFDIMKHVYSIEPQVYHYACMAEMLIRSMPMKPDVYVWGALLGGCQMHGNIELGERVALHLIELQPENHAFYMNLCDIYAKAGRFDAAKRIRNLMKERGIKKEIPGCSMIEINGVVHEFSVGRSSELLTKELVFVLSKLSNEMKT